MILKNKKIFISGAAGVLGRQLVKLLEKENCLLFAADIKNRPLEFSKKVFYRQGDLNQIKEHEVRSYECEIFIHLASTSEKIHKNFNFYDENFKDNALLSNKLLKLFCKTDKLKKVFFASSYLVYDKSLYLTSKLKSPVSLNEKSPKDTRDLFGATKYFHEKEIQFYNKFKKKLKFYSIRIFKSYGLDSRDIISRWVKSALKKETINLYNEESSFDFIFPIDSARGILQIIKKSPKKIEINLGSGKSIKIKEVISILKSNFKDLSIKRLKSDNLVCKSVSGNKIMRTINWFPFYSVKLGIKKIIEYEKKKQEQNLKTKKDKILVTCFGEKKIPWLKHIIDSKNRINKDLELAVGNSKKIKFIETLCGKILLMPKIQNYSFKTILKILKSNNIKIVLPTHNDELLFWSKYKKDFKKNKIDIIISPLNTIKLCNDKYRFYKYCKKNDIRTIDTIVDFKKINDLKTDHMFVKERFGSGSKRLIKNANYKKVENSLIKFDNYIIQENIFSKQEYSVDAWYSGNFKLCKYFVRKRELIEDGESKITSAIKNFRHKKILEKYLSCFKLYGPVNFQFFINNNKILLIECNPRFGGASTFAINSGLDLFYYSFLNSYYNNNHLDKILKKRILYKGKQFRIKSDIYENYSL